MKFVIRTWIVLLAAAIGVGANAALAAQPGPLLIASQGRLSEGAAMRNASLMTEGDEAPSSTSPAIEPEPEWDGSASGPYCDEGCDTGCVGLGMVERGK